MGECASCGAVVVWGRLRSDRAPQYLELDEDNLLWQGHICPEPDAGPPNERWFREHTDTLTLVIRKPQVVPRGATCRPNVAGNPRNATIRRPPARGVCLA